MQQFKTPTDMQTQALQWRAQAETIAFVPTMGALHEGHLSLLRTARSQADHLVLSIFVNPAQFAAHEDLDEYPRSLEADLEAAKSEGVDAVFLPTPETMSTAGTKIRGVCLPTQ